MLKTNFGWILGGGTVSALVGVMAYSLRARVDIWRMTKQANISVTSTPIAVMERAIQARDKMLEVANQKLYDFVEQHAKNDQDKQERLIAVLTEMKAAMVDLARDQRDMREEAARRSAQNHEDLGRVKERLSRIEIKVGLEGGA